ncbi:helix-turn-helix transcriptional regulator, partial [Parageobacillus sp. SY1]
MNEQQWLKELLKLNEEDVKLSEKQIKILEAAIEMFAEKGYAATSTSEIAK